MHEEEITRKNYQKETPWWNVRKFLRNAIAWKGNSSRQCFEGRAFMDVWEKEPSSTSWIGTSLERIGSLGEFLGQLEGLWEHLRGTLEDLGITLGDCKG